MKVGFCQSPCELTPESAAWDSLAEAIAGAGADIFVLNEMPFGSWLPLSPTYDREQASVAVELHERALDSFGLLATPVVISSRPVPAGARLANEAFAWVEGAYVPLHHKQYFPNEPGFYESAWFHAEQRGYEAREVGGVKLGAQMCTELMFNEWARFYGREGAQLIAGPRASGVSLVKWQAALSMAAVVSGCYVVSSNRVGREGGLTFGGVGMAYAPGGELIAQTSSANPVCVVDLDLDLVAGAQADWPCYVPEIAAA